jgi:hypothetical protein
MVVAGFVGPYLLDTTTRFVAAAAGLPDVKLALVTCEPADRLPPQLKHSLAGHWRIDDPLDAGQIAWAVEGLSGQLGPVQLLAAYGEHVVALELLPVGAPRRDWRATLIADGMVIIRHPDLAPALEIAQRFAADLRLYAS